MIRGLCLTLIQIIETFLPYFPLVNANVFLLLVVWRSRDFWALRHCLFVLVLVQAIGHVYHPLEIVVDVLSLFLLCRLEITGLRDGRHEG